MFSMCANERHMMPMTTDPLPGNDALLYIQKMQNQAPCFLFKKESRFKGYKGSKSGITQDGHSNEIYFHCYHHHNHKYR